jgi:hypothetical protein
MLKVSGELLTKGFEGSLFFDNIITEGGAPGASFGKRKLRGLIGELVDSPQGLDDDKIAEMLLGKHFFVDFIHEPWMDIDEGTGKYTKPRYEIDARTGKQVQVQKNIAQRYYAHAVGGVSAPAPQVAAPAQHRLPIVDTPAPGAVQAPATPPTNGSNSATPPWVQAHQQATAAPAAEGSKRGGKRTVAR